MFTLIALTSAIVVVGIYRSAQLVLTDGHGPVPTRKF